MNLYLTPQGRWLGTQADAAKATRDEGSKPGSWKSVSVPTDKPGLLAFLNNGPLKAHTPPPAPAPPAKAKQATVDGLRRFRVYFNNLFAGVIHADSQAEAEAGVDAFITVRPAMNG